MVSCDPAPPPQCSWFSGRERKRVEQVRGEEEEEKAVEMELVSAVVTADDEGGDALEMVVKT